MVQWTDGGDPCLSGEEEEKEEMKKNGWVKVLLLAVILLAVFSFSYMVRAEDQQTWSDDFTTWDNWKWETGWGLTDPAISSGKVELKDASADKHEASTWIGHYASAGQTDGSGYVNFTFQAKAGGTLSGSNYIALHAEGIYEPGKNSVVGFYFLNTGQLQCLYRNDGTGWQSDRGPYGTAWHTYTILWEQNRTKWYVDGVLNYTLANNVGLPDEPLRILMHADSAAGESFLVDDVTIREDRELSYGTPSLTGFTENLNDTGVWTEGNATLTIRTKNVGADNRLFAYVPLSFKNYFAEVRDDGVATTNVKFIRALRQLNVSSLSSGYSKIDVKMVDPPEWLVDFSYWFMAATGFSLVPLLKIWDRLAKKHRLLPYIVMLLGLGFLAVAVCLIWQCISFQAAHLKV